MNFQVGDKVVCIDNIPGEGTKNGHYVYPNGYLKLNQVYVIEQIIPRVKYKYSIIQDELVLVGLPVSSIKDSNIHGFNESRFKKLDKIKEDNMLLEMK